MLQKLNFKIPNKKVVLTVVIIIAIALISLLINTGKAKKRNTQRELDVTVLSSAVYQYSIDNNRLLPKTVTSEPVEICAKNNCGPLVDLSVLKLNDKYLSPLPMDPQGPINPNGTGYFIQKGARNRIIISAPRAEKGAVISVIR